MAISLFKKGMPGVGFDAFGCPLKFRSFNEARYKYLGIPEDAVFYASLKSGRAVAETGQPLTVHGQTSYGKVDGVPCVYFNGTARMEFPDDDLPMGRDDRTMSCFVKLLSPGAMVFGYGGIYDDQAGGLSCIEIGGDGEIWFTGYQADLISDGGIISIGNWYNIVTKLEDGREYIYVNSIQVAEGSSRKNTKSAFGYMSGTEDLGGMFEGYLASCRVYDRALTDEEIKALSKEFAI